VRGCPSSFNELGTFDREAHEARRPELSQFLGPVESSAFSQTIQEVLESDFVGWREFVEIGELGVNFGHIRRIGELEFAADVDVSLA
jgi:hypothetical protein